MRNLTILVFSAALLAFTACTAPDWSSAQATEVRFRDGIPGNQVAVVSDPTGLAFVLSAFRRASRENPTEADRQQLWASMCFDVIGDPPLRGRWLYAPGTGMFSRLDPMMQPVFRMAAEDRIRFNELMRKKD